MNLDPDKSLDHRLADLMWVLEWPKSATLEAFMAGGYLAGVENDELRQALIVRRSWFNVITWHSTQVDESFNETVTHLGRHASLVQISNAAAVHGLPGLDGSGATPDDLLPIGKEIDHSFLLRDREFAGIVVNKLWVHTDILLELPEYIEATRELVRLIDQEIKETN